MCVEGDFEKILDVPKDKPLVGYRFWSVRTDDKGPYLVPAIIAYPPEVFTWRTGQAKSHLRPTSPDSRKYDSDVGLHFTKRPMPVNERYGYYVYGKCHLWGRVAVYSRGFLAEKAKVVSIGKDGNQALAIAKRIKVTAR